MSLIGQIVGLAKMVTQPKKVIHTPCHGVTVTGSIALTLTLISVIFSEKFSKCRMMDPYIQAGNTGIFK